MFHHEGHLAGGEPSIGAAGINRFSRHVWTFQFQIVTGRAASESTSNRQQPDSAAGKLQNIFCINCVIVFSMAGKSKAPSRPPAPITSPKIRHLAGEGLERPSTLTTKEVRELAASVMAHIEPRKPATKK